MISCQNFRANLQPGTDDAALLEHLRQCDSCLDFAANVDPDLMFRSLGSAEGVELVPPGGVDAFAADVMRQVRLRETESTLDHRHNALTWRQRLAIAATLAAGVMGGTLVYQYEQRAIIAPAPMAAVTRSATAVPVNLLTTKPIVETYDSQNATIVEVPNDDSNNNDTKVVMIFDDKLPADL